MTLNTIYKTKNVIKVSPENQLSHVVSLFSSSHDSAFVFDDDDRFLGLINPYYCLIRKSYPANTKIKHCLVHPPHIDINFSLKKTARLMLDSKIYYLPVFSGDQFVGIISARRLLSAMKDSQRFSFPVGSFLKYKHQPLVSLYENDFLSKALGLFKRYRVSRLVVLSKDFKLRGVVTYFDLISYLLTPKEKQHFSSREGNKIPFLKQYVRTAMRNSVVVANKEDKLGHLVDNVLEKEVGSIVIVDRERHPIGIVTIHDLISIAIGRRLLFNVEVITKNLSQKSEAKIMTFVHRINNRLSKIRDLSKARICIKEEKKGGLYRAAFSLFSRGNRLAAVITQEGKNLRHVLQTIFKKTKNI